MSEFVVIFLVVLSCTGGLFIVLYFSPKAFPFFADWGSRLGAFLADWRASTKEREAELERERRCKERLERERRCEERLERERRRREQNHLRSGWDWNWLVASICGFLFGAFLIWAGDSMQKDMNRAIDEDDDGRFPLVVWGETVFTNQAQFNKTFEMHGRVFIFGFWIALPSLLGVLIFGVKFCRRYFSAEARYRRILDREEWLAAERRRRQEGRQDD